MTSAQVYLLSNAQGRTLMCPSKRLVSTMENWSAAPGVRGSWHHVGPSAASHPERGAHLEYAWSFIVGSDVPIKPLGVGSRSAVSWPQMVAPRPLAAMRSLEVEDHESKNEEEDVEIAASFSTAPTVCMTYLEHMRLSLGFAARLLAGSSPPSSTDWSPAFCPPATTLLEDLSEAITAPDVPQTVERVDPPWRCRFAGGVHPRSKARVRRSANAAMEILLQKWLVPGTTAAAGARAAERRPECGGSVVVKLFSTARFFAPTSVRTSQWRSPPRLR